MDACSEQCLRRDVSWWHVQAFKTYKLGGKLSELLYSPAAVHGMDLQAASVKPRARANPMMAVCHNTLFLYGGVVEVNPPPSSLV